MRILYITSILLLISINLSSSTLAGWGGNDNCENYRSEGECRANGNCAYLPFISCCGKKEFFCVNKDSKGCCDELSCSKNTKTGEIFELWSSCKPHRDFEHYNPPNATCESLCCEERGMDCEWVDSKCSNGEIAKTSCCGRQPVCTIRDNGNNQGGGKCNRVKCPKGFYCEENDNGEEACCVPYQDGCSNVQCPIGHYCVNENGGACCVANKPPPPPPEPSCSNLECPKGYSCKIIDNCATCVRDPCKEQDVCKKHKCPKNSHCEVDEVTGEPCCIKERVHPHKPHRPPPPPLDPCDTVNCGINYHCKVIDGCATCLRNDDYLCNQTRCPRNFVCNKFSSTIVKCVPEDDECDLIRCPIGESCFNSRDGPRCIANNLYPPLCRATNCPKDFLCRLVRGNPTCIKSKPPVPPPHCVTCLELAGVCNSVGLICRTTPNTCGPNPNIPCCPTVSFCANAPMLI